VPSFASLTLEGAFVALGSAPTWEELHRAAETLRSSGDHEALDLLDAASECRDGALEELERIAVAAGSNLITALDVVDEYGRAVDGEM
jgi:hypothetical protein